MPNLHLHPFTPTKNAITIPGSKSDTNRALILGSISQGTTTIHNYSPSNDSKLLIDNLRMLGIRIEEIEGRLEVYGNDGKFQEFYGELNVGIAGTVARFVTALCVLIRGEYIINASGVMLTRPMSILFQALEDLGIEYKCLEQAGCLPIRITNKTIPNGGSMSMDGSVSSQYFTAMLLVGWKLASGISITVDRKLVSQSYIHMTLQTLSKFGINSEITKDSEGDIRKLKILYTKSKTDLEYHVEVDYSGCSYFLGLAAVTGSELQINNCNPDSVQGDRKFLDCLEAMGCQIQRNSESNFIKIIPTSSLVAGEFDMENMPDVAQTLAVVACFANGTTRLNGLATLKVKETDRILSIHTELLKLGIATRYGTDWLEIDGISPDQMTKLRSNPNPVVFQTYHDHRMAMSLSLFGAIFPNIIIEDYEVVAKSFPNYWEKWSELGGVFDVG
jgi:3-phosphoshikimate 1-carboxyvinyltransferase